MNSSFKAINVDVCHVLSSNSPLLSEKMCACDDIALVIVAAAAESRY